MRRNSVFEEFRVKRHAVTQQQTCCRTSWRVMLQAWIDIRWTKREEQLCIISIKMMVHRHGRNKGTEWSSAHKELLRMSRMSTEPWEYHISTHEKRINIYPKYRLGISFHWEIYFAGFNWAAENAAFYSQSIYHQWSIDKINTAF